MMSQIFRTIVGGIGYLTPRVKVPQVQPLTATLLARNFAKQAAKAKKDCKKDRPTIGCACARHPWPDDDKECEEVVEKPTCDFNFRKLVVNPYDIPCDCKDPPPAAGCADVGRPKEVCCRSIRQYGCHCEEEESCEEEEEDVHLEEVKTCDLDFKKLEVFPYDDPCECRESGPADSCDALANKDICCRTPRPFGCFCEAYDEPGLDCFKQKAPVAKRSTKECKKREWKGKCL